MKPQFISRDKIDPKWPTHKGDPEFWEELGRAVAAFGFLEDVLARAYYCLSGDRKPDDKEDFEAEVDKWKAELEASLTDTLAALTSRIDSAYKQDARITAGIARESSVA